MLLKHHRAVPITASPFVFIETNEQKKLMIDVEIVRKAKSGGQGSSVASVSGGSGNADYAQEAGHAAAADNAKYAANAGNANHATRAANLDEDSTDWQTIDAKDEAVKKYADDNFLSKVKEDTAQKLIRFLEGLTSDEIATFLKGLTSEDIARFLKGITIGASGSYSINENGDATLGKVTAEEMLNSDYGGDDILSGKGYRYFLDGNRRSHLITDFLSVRMKAFFSELEIRKVSASNGNIVFSNAGSKIVQVTPFPYGKAEDEPGLHGFTCYYEEDDGTTATTNSWRVGDQAMCRTFNIKEGVHKDVSNRYYWRLVIHTGSSQDLPNAAAAGDKDTEKKKYGYVVLADYYVNADGTRTTLVDTLTDDDGTELHPYGYDPKKADNAVYFRLKQSSNMPEGWTLNDAPRKDDAIVQLGCQTSGGVATRGNAMQIVTNGEDGTAIPSLNMFSAINDYDLSRFLVIQISPKGVKGTLQRADIKVVDGAGNPISLFNYRGVWTNGTTVYKGDVFTYGGQSWAWNGNDNSKPAAPSSSVSGWELTAAQGDKGDNGGGIVNVTSVFAAGGPRREVYFTLSGIAGGGSAGGGFKGRFEADMVSLAGERKTVRMSLENGGFLQLNKTRERTLWYESWEGTDEQHVTIRATKTGSSGQTEPAFVFTQGNNDDFHIQTGEENGQDSYVTITLKADKGWRIQAYRIIGNARSSNKPCTFTPLGGTCVLTSNSGASSNTETYSRSLTVMGGGRGTDTLTVDFGGSTAPSAMFKEQTRFSNWFDSATAYLSDNYLLCTIWEVQLTNYEGGRQSTTQPNPTGMVSDKVEKVKLYCKGDASAPASSLDYDNEYTGRPGGWVTAEQFTPGKGSYVWSATEYHWPGGAYSYSQPSLDTYMGNDGTDGTNGRDGRDGRDGASVGRNLLRHADTLEKKDSLAVSDSLDDSCYQGCKVCHAYNTNISDENWEMLQWTDMENTVRKDTWYTLSFLCKGNGRLLAYLYSSGVELAIDRSVDGGDIVQTTDGAAEIPLSSEWSSHYIRWRVTSDTMPKFLLFRCAVGNEAYVCQPKLEEGENATAFDTNEADKAGKDGHSPYIKDGYWYYWDDKNGWVKGDKAQGEHGEHGIPGQPAVTYEIYPVRERASVDINANATTVGEKVSVSGTLNVDCRYTVYQITGGTKADTPLIGVTISAAYDNGSTEGLSTDSQLQVTAKGTSYSSTDGRHSVTVTFTYGGSVIGTRSVPITLTPSSQMIAEDTRWGHITANENSISALQQTANEINLKVDTIRQPQKNLLAMGSTGVSESRGVPVNPAYNYTLGNITAGKPYTVTFKAKVNNAAHIGRMFAWQQNGSEWTASAYADVKSSTPAVYAFAFTPMDGTDIHVQMQEYDANGNTPSSYDGTVLEWVRIDEGDLSANPPAGWQPSDADVEAVNLLPDWNFAHPVSSAYSGGEGTRNVVSTQTGSEINNVMRLGTDDGGKVPYVEFRRESGYADADIYDGLEWYIPFHGAGRYSLSASFKNKRGCTASDGNRIILELHPCDGSGKGIRYGTNCVFDSNNSNEYGWVHKESVLDVAERESDVKVEYLQVKLFMTQNGDMAASRICVSKCSHATVFNAAELSDARRNEARQLATGIDIYQGRIVMTADNIKFRNSQGEVKALIGDNGVEAVALRTRATKDGCVIIRDGVINVYDTEDAGNGVYRIKDDDETKPRIRIGKDGGQLVFSFYDNNGNLLYNLGPDGLDSSMTRNASLQYPRMHEFAGGENAEALKLSDNDKRRIRGNEFTSSDFDNSTYMQYTAGRLGGVIVKDEYHGLQDSRQAVALDGCFINQNNTDKTRLDKLVKQSGDAYEPDIQDGATFLCMMEEDRNGYLDASGNWQHRYYIVTKGVPAPFELGMTDNNNA